MATLPDSVVETCARSAHEVNRAYCIALGDLSQPSWEDAPDWQRLSARNGVKAALDGATPEQSHEGWLREKIDAGWVWGPVKDPKAVPPTHPCLVRYADLPPEQQAKDELYTTVVRAVAKAVSRIVAG
jgi:RyR domain